jgi:hypothetical protein
MQLSQEKALESYPSYGNKKTIYLYYSALNTKKRFAEALPYLFFKAIKQTHSIDKKTRNRNVKEALKLFPENKEMLREWRRNIDEVL